MENESGTRENKIHKKIFGILFYGVVINFIILVYLDMKVDCGRSFDDAVCTPYPFYLICSLFIGWIVSVVISKLEHKK